MKIIVDISDARFTNSPADEIITYSLGSCIGVVMHEPNTKATGLLHYQLPSCGKGLAVVKKPFMYADLGVEYMLGKMRAMGAQKKKIQVKIAGGAQIMNDAKFFNIGKRNHVAIRQLMWKHGMFIVAEDVGGGKARTMSVTVNDGAVTIKSQGVISNL